MDPVLWNKFWLIDWIKYICTVFVIKWMVTVTKVTSSRLHLALLTILPSPRRLASGEGIVMVGVCCAVCVSAEPWRRYCTLLTAFRVHNEMYHIRNFISAHKWKIVRSSQISTFYAWDLRHFDPNSAQKYASDYILHKPTDQKINFLRLFFLKWKAWHGRNTASVDYVSVLKLFSTAVVSHQWWQNQKAHTLRDFLFTETQFISPTIIPLLWSVFLYSALLYVTVMNC